MKQKNGFIATSMIYSFFLVFLMMMLATATKNAEVRELLRVYKDDVIKELNEKEFIPIKLSQAETFPVGAEIDFVGDTWKILKDNGTSVTLILKRALNEAEIKSALGLNMTENNPLYFVDNCNGNSCNVRMCTNGFTSNHCYYVAANNYLYYNWSNSVVRDVVEHWLESNTNIQKICRQQYNSALNKYECKKENATLMEMTFSDGIANQKGYIRIPTKNELDSNFSWLPTDMWTLTNEKNETGNSFINVFNTSKIAHANVYKIYPIIEVRKS